MDPRDKIPPTTESKQNQDFTSNAIQNEQSKPVEVAILQYRASKQIAIPYVYMMPKSGYPYSFTSNKAALKRSFDLD